MTFLTAVRAELARLTATRLGTISLIALMTIPLAYGGLYLWGNRDPYGALDRVPAALVVEDAGAQTDGTQAGGTRVDYGRDAADTVLKAGTFRWTETTLARAHAGVKDGTYDFALVIPRSFSADLLSASGTDPVRAELGLYTSDTNSYLSSTIATQAADRIAASVAQKVGRTATLKLLDGVADLRSGLQKGADAAGTLATGAGTAASGAATLADGTSQLEDGSAQLASGLDALHSRAATLPGSAAQLSSGAAQVSSGIGQVHGLAAKTQADAAAILAGSDVPPAEQQALLAELGALSASTAPTSQLGAGSAAVASGAAELDAQAPGLVTAIGQAASGAHTVASGSAAAANGAAQLKEGTAQLTSGSGQLRDALAQGAAQAPDRTPAERRAIATAVADPLAVHRTAATEAADYGAGLAPFFMSLAAWIGIYALFLLVRPLSRRALTARRRPVSVALAGWVVPAALGVVQMAALFAVVTLVLHLPVAAPLGLLAFLALVAAAYAAIVLALNVWLGSVGQFLGLLLMVVQLVTAGGTFPWQTLPGPLAALHRALPMSHAVDGIRQLMYGGTGGMLAEACGILAVWLVGALLVAVAGAWKQSGYRTLRELRPSAIGG